MIKNYYEILGVEKDSTPEEIKKAYYKLSKEHHPDTGGKAETFNEIKKAYEVLSDPDERAYFDEHGIAKDAGLTDEEKINSMTTEILMAVIQKLPDEYDEFILMMYDNGKSTLENQIKQIKSKNKELANFKIRIKELPDDNKLVLLIDVQIASNIENIEQIKRTLELMEIAFDYVNSYIVEDVEDKEEAKVFFDNIEIDGFIGGFPSGKAT